MAQKLVVAPPELAAKIASMLVESGETQEIETVWCAEASELAGLHFASLPNYVEVKFKGKEEKLYLFSKENVGFPTPELTKLGEYMATKEGQFLTVVIPEINDYVFKTSGWKDFLRPNFPKSFCYDVKGMTMENLYKAGYVMYDKTKRQGYAAAVAVFRAYGRLHGASWAWAKSLGGVEKVKEKYPLLFQDILDDPAGLNLMETMVGNTIKIIASTVTDMKDSDINTKSIMDKYSKHAKPGTSVMGDIKDKLKSDSHLRCISHSDCWTNNMMFKPDHSNVKLIDFQIVRFNCGSIDLAEYLSTSVSEDVRKSWKTLFNLYYQTMKEAVEMTGQKFPLTIKDILEDFVNKHEIGLSKGLHLIFGRESQEAYNVHESKEGLDPEVFANTVKTWLKNNPDKLHGIIKQCADLVDDFVAIRPYTE